MTSDPPVKIAAAFEDRLRLAGVNRIVQIDPFDEHHFIILTPDITGECHVIYQVAQGNPDGYRVSVTTPRRYDLPGENWRNSL